MNCQKNRVRIFYDECIGGSQLRNRFGFMDHHSPGCCKATLLLPAAFANTLAKQLPGVVPSLTNFPSKPCKVGSLPRGQLSLLSINPSKVGAHISINYICESLHSESFSPSLVFTSHLPLNPKQEKYGRGWNPTNDRHTFSNAEPPLAQSNLKYAPTGGSSSPLTRMYTIVHALSPALSRGQVCVPLVMIQGQIDGVLISVSCSDFS